MTSFGAFAFVRATLLLAAGVVTAGIGHAAGFLLARQGADRRQCVGTMIGVLWVTALVLATAMTALYCIAAPFVSEVVFGEGDVGSLILFTAPAVFLMVVSGVGMGIINGFLAFDEAAMIHLWHGLATLVGTVVLTFAFNLTGAVLALDVAAVVQLALVVGATRRLSKAGSIKWSLKGWHSELGSLLRFATPNVLGNLLAQPMEWLAMGFLGRHGGRHVAEFRASLSVASMARFAPAAATQISGPLLSRVYGTEHGLFRTAARANLRTTWLMIVPVLLVLGSSSRLLVTRLFGSDYEDAWIVVALLLGAGGLASVSERVGQQLWASNRPWRVNVLTIPWFATMILGIALFLDEGSAIQVARIYLVAEVVRSFTMLGEISSMRVMSIVELAKYASLTAIVYACAFAVAYRFSPVSAAAIGTAAAVPVVIFEFRVLLDAGERKALRASVRSALRAGRRIWLLRSR
jgi:O-antigen/teichoic acid export membrane protein